MSERSVVMLPPGATLPFAVSEKRRIGCAALESLPEKSPIKISARAGAATTMARNNVDRRNADRVVIATNAVVDPVRAHFSTTQQSGASHHDSVKKKPERIRPSCF